MNQNIIILTGEIQSGKTTLLQTFCKKYSNTAGILTPVINGKRVFYTISSKEVFQMEATAAEVQLCVGKYIFSAAAFEKAANQLLSASEEGDLDYLIVDEIGPLEIKLHQGFYNVLQKIMQQDSFKTLILVVRPSLIKECHQLPGLQEALVLTKEEYTNYFQL